MKAVDGLKIVYLPISALTPYERNAKEHPRKQIDQIKRSISDYGMRDPIGIWGKNNVIVEGHGRWMACKELGFTEVPCIRLDDMTDAQRREYALVHNQTTMNSELDLDVLDLELGELPEFDASFYDFEVSQEEPEIEEDEVPDVPDEPKTKVCDIYQLGRHRLICGDSTDANFIDMLMDGVKADMVLTDPPYGMHLDTDFSTIHGSLKSIGRKNNTQGNKYESVIGDNDDFSDDLINTIFDNFESKEMFLFGADYYAELLPDKNNGSWLVWDKRKESQADAIGSEFELIWSRQKHKRRMLRHDWFGFLSSENQSDARNRVHPTQKPVTLLVDILTQWGKDSKNIVDLYGGSGSTLIACEQTNRNCYMMELDPRYVDVIIERWERFTGQKAVKLNG